jgi:sugar phosphate isomerase/epimerase
MNVGFTADQYRNLSIYTILRILRWTGIRFSEVTTNIFQYPSRALKITRGMTLGLHLPNMGNCGFDFSSEDKREKVEHALNDIKRHGKAFDFKYVVCHPPEGSPDSSSLTYYLKNLEQVDTPLVLENIRSWSTERFIELYQRLKKALGGKIAGLCLDIPHAYLADEDWTTFYRKHESEIKVIHLSDCKDDEDLHLPFGMGGELSLQQILESLRLFEFDGILNFEINPPSPAHLEAVFSSYLKAREFSGYEGQIRMLYRMRLIALLGKALKSIL